MHSILVTLKYLEGFIRIYRFLKHILQKESLWKMHRTIALRSFLVLAVLLASSFFTFSAIRHSLAAQAQPLTTTTTEYHIPSGTNPWGTAVDRNGKIWVALPGCDPSPTCSSGTAPVRIDVFNPLTSKWVACHPLSSGFAQPLILAF